MTRKNKYIDKIIYCGTVGCCIFVIHEENDSKLAVDLKANSQALKMGVNAVNRIFI